MKECIFSRILIIVIIFITSCTSSYNIINESDFKFLSDQINSIYVGWLDLDETKWKDYRYESIDKWKNCIYQMNVQGVQKYLKELLPNKIIKGDTSKSNNFPDSGDLFIKCNIVHVEEINVINVWRGGEVKDIQSITVAIQFFDIKTRKEFFHSTIEANNVNPNIMTGVTSTHTFELELSNIVYNLSKYISTKFKR